MSSISFCLTILVDFLDLKKKFVENLCDCLTRRSNMLPKHGGLLISNNQTHMGIYFKLETRRFQIFTV